MIYLLVEGRTELALKQLLADDIKALGVQGVGLKVITLKGKERLLKEARVLVRNCLTKADWVFALVDLHPGDATPGGARKRLVEAVAHEHRERFRPHVAVHDIEAWMLASWDALCQVAGCRDLKCKYPNPETVDDVNHPKTVVQDLFRRHSKRGGYRETVDGPSVFRLASPDEIAAKCPHFKALREDLLQCAGLAAPPTPHPGR